MKLIFRGHDDRYAVEQSLLAFFPEERPVYEPAEDGEDHALVTLSRSPRYNTAVTTITYHGRTARGISRTAVDPQLTEYEAERLRQKAVKLSFFKAARDITGITPSWGALTGIRPGKLASRMLEEGMTERQVERVLRDTYFVSPERRRLCIETAEASRRAKAELKPEDISLYVGIPFCPTRCAYCSFVSQSVERTLGLVEPYLEVLHREITDAARMVQETGLHIKSFYMGGGTPTTLSADQMDRLLTHLNRSFDLSGCVEYCIEAGRPDTIDREKLQVLLDHGVDRISVNPQSLEDHVLTAIGRRHTARDVEEAMALATGMGFPHVNMDLIAGLPEDTPEGFRRTLDKCLSYGADNITVHTLSLKKGSRILLENFTIPSAEAVGEMLDYALRYGRVLMLSLPTFILQNMFQSFFVTAEKPHLGFYFTVGAGCTNMVLDVLLVGILHWSVEGAAIATMLSQVVGGLLPVFYFLNRKNTSLLHLCRPRFEGKVLLNACINGSSELMTNLSMSLVNILYNYQLLRFAGEDGVAAYGVIMYASFLFVAVFVGYAVGSAPIVSYHYGANNRKEVNNLYRKSLKLIGVVAVGMTIGSMFIIPHVARFFVGYDENLLILTTRAFRLYGLSFLIMGFNVYASSFFTALGDGVTSALISFLRTLLFQVAAVLLLPLLLGIDGIWLAVTAAELAALLVSIGLFITRDRQFHYRKAE